MSLSTKHGSGLLPAHPTVHELISFLGEGNIGAITMLTTMVVNVEVGKEAAVLDRLLHLCDMGVSGHHLWFLYKYICDADREKFVRVIDAFRTRAIARPELHAALDIDGDFEKREAAQRVLKQKVFGA